MHPGRAPAPHSKLFLSHAALLLRSLRISFSLATRALFSGLEVANASARSLASACRFSLRFGKFLRGMFCLSPKFDFLSTEIVRRSCAEVLIFNLRLDAIRP